MYKPSRVQNYHFGSKRLSDKKLIETFNGEMRVSGFISKNAISHCYVCWAMNFVKPYPLRPANNVVWQNIYRFRTLRQQKSIKNKRHLWTGAIKFRFVLFFVVFSCVKQLDFSCMLINVDAYFLYENWLGTPPTWGSMYYLRTNLASPPLEVQPII